MKQKNPSREVREQGAPQESAQSKCEFCRDGIPVNTDGLTHTSFGVTRLCESLPMSQEKFIASLCAELVTLRAELEEVQRAKYGTPCKCESWIAACAVAEKRAEAAEAALATARREACREAVL